MATSADPSLNPATGVLSPNQNGQNQLAIQTSEWLDIQNYANNAINFFPANLTSQTFQDQFGSFNSTSSWSVDNELNALETAVQILSTINTLALKFGNPLTAWQEINTIAQSAAPPDHIYGHAVWLAEQININSGNILASLAGTFNTTIQALTDAKVPNSTIASIVIAALLGNQMTDTLATTAEMTTALNESSLTAEIVRAFTQNGATLSSNTIVYSQETDADISAGIGMNKWWIWDKGNNLWYMIANVNNELQFFDGSGQITATVQLSYYCNLFNTLTSDWIISMNNALNGKTNSLQWYLNQSGNVLTDAEAALTADQNALAAAQTALSAAQDEYNHDVIVAATSPTYAWIFPFGTIAAAIVAGIYGAKAVAAKKAIAAAEDEIANNDNADITKKTSLVTAVTGLNTNATSLELKGNSFLSTVQGMENGFMTITADLSAICKDVIQNPDRVSVYTTPTKISEAQSNWGIVQTAAQAFIITGLITIPVSASNLTDASTNPAIQTAAVAVSKN